MAKTEPQWHHFTKLDIGELNQLNEQLFKTRYNPDQSYKVALRELIQDHYSYDIMSGAGPYLAVVLKVLSGPQVNNEASTGGSLTKTISHLKNNQSVEVEVKKQSGKKPPIKVIARIPEFDRDVDWPSGEDDEARIAIHGEFHESIDYGSKNLEKITPGSVILVQYSNTENQVSTSGRPVGKIIGIHEIGTFSKVFKKESPKENFEKECKTTIKRSNPASGALVGSTEENPNQNPGPPIRKIKGMIKTGMYGPGSIQTKAHFDQSLKTSLPSSKHKIPGPAPDSTSAFIWIGHLKNNGHMDILNRPADTGRETIIYAPSTLDVSSPIEIKYYFHDESGFGRSWNGGLAATKDDAEQSASTGGNDFREKIAPALKDMIRDGRNFILVVPEMAHSLGYGPYNVSDMAYARVHASPALRPRIKSLMGEMSSTMDINLSYITPLDRREMHTFDGSYSGGRFGVFHQEVLEVLDQHLGTIYNKVGFISILADGISAITLSSMVRKTESPVQSSAASSFRDVNVNRIDLIDYGRMNSLAYWNLFNGRSPIYAFYKDHLKLQASKPFYLEFNHIVVPSNIEEHPLYMELGTWYNEKYKKSNKKAAGAAERRFSFVIDEGTIENCFSMHQASSNPVGYAFSMINDFIPSFSGLPGKSNANASNTPPHSAVPDHAMAAFIRPANATLAKLQKEREDLSAPIKHFENLLLSLQGDVNKLCATAANDLYKIYCNEGRPVVNNSSVFFRNYLDYLSNKKKYILNGLLAEFEVEIQNARNDKNKLQDILDLAEEDLSTVDINNDMDTAQDSINSQWEDLKSSFDALTFSDEVGYLDSSDIESGYLAILAEQVAREEALQMKRTSLKEAIKKAKPSPIKRDIKCDPPPKKISETVRPREPDAPDTGPREPQQFSCEGNNIVTPDTYEELVKMIPYYPKKSDFSFSEERTWSRSHTKLKQVEGYKIGKFKYLARGINNTTKYLESPPIWACLVPIIEQGWEKACSASNYIPFGISNALRGSHGKSGVTAYKAGHSLHGIGLAFDLDPWLAGYSKTIRKGGKTVWPPLNSVYTGAWTGKLLLEHGEELYRLGVFKSRPSQLVKNAFEGDNKIRLAENWNHAPDAYKTGRSKYRKAMNAAKGSPIVPYNANPTLWMIVFCETTGMKLGNARFLIKRYRGGKKWSEAEQKRIAEIYGIPDIVQRVKKLSWKTRSVDDHMHFHFWGGKSLVSWSEIHKARKARKNKK